MSEPLMPSRWPIGGGQDLSVLQLTSHLTPYGIATALLVRLKASTSTWEVTTKTKNVKDFLGMDVLSGNRVIAFKKGKYYWPIRGEC